jgi:hypothetical protein
MILIAFSLLLFSPPSVVGVLPSDFLIVYALIL